MADFASISRSPKLPLMYGNTGNVFYFKYSFDIALIYIFNIFPQFPTWGRLYEGRLA